MRFRFSRAKSESLRRNSKRGIGFEEAQEIFQHPYYQDQRSDYPQQYRAIGWVKSRLFSVIFEVREDGAGEYYHLARISHTLSSRGGGEGRGHKARDRGPRRRTE